LALFIPFADIECSSNKHGHPETARGCIGTSPTASCIAAAFSEATSVQVSLDKLTLTTSRLRLRILSAVDREEWIHAHLASRLEFERWMPKVDPTITMQERFDFNLQRALEGVRGDSQYSFVAEHLQDGGLVAFLSLSQVFRGPFLNAYAGWRVSTPYTGKGIGSEAVSAMLDLAFAPLPGGIGLHRVQANVIPTNTPSVKLARRVGFREEGYAKQYLEIAGEWQDHLMFAKLSDEHCRSAGSIPP
jgi:ribosomal-protein-alanine N-acetyltransferase